MGALGPEGKVTELRNQSYGLLSENTEIRSKAKVKSKKAKGENSGTDLHGICTGLILVRQLQRYYISMCIYAYILIE